MNNPSELLNFHYEWFLWFMTSGNYSMDDEHQRREYEQLLKQWTSYFERKSYMLDKVIMKLDGLLNSFPPMLCDSDKNNCFKIFVHHMIDICFKPGKKLSLHRWK